MSVRQLPPDVFARLAPELYFERHWEQGTRPSGRQLNEWRPIDITEGTQDLGPATLGSAVARAGEAVVLCGIVGALTDLQDEAGIYVNVETKRGGRGGNPSIEEQVLTAAAHRLVTAADVPPENWIISENSSKRLVLQASVLVLSRTGPCLDLVWAAVVSALRNTRIPGFVEDEKTQEWVVDESAEQRVLELGATFPNSTKTVGIFKGTLVADVDGPVEENCITDRISVSRNSAGFTSVSLAASSPISTDALIEALRFTS